MRISSSFLMHHRIHDTAAVIYDLSVLQLSRVSFFDSNVYDTIIFRPLILFETNTCTITSILYSLYVFLHKILSEAVCILAGWLFAHLIDSEANRLTDCFIF